MDSLQAKPYTKKGADQTQAGSPPDKIHRWEENMPSKYLEPLMKLLALEYNCEPEDFLRPENVLTLSALREGRRRYSDEKAFFQMATLGQNAVITADSKLHPFLHSFSRERGRTLFEFPSLLPLNDIPLQAISSNAASIVPRIQMIFFMIPSNPFSLSSFS